MRPETAAPLLPAEWTPQEAVMLTWPHPATAWGGQLAETEAVYLALATAICRFQSLIVACHDQAVKNHVSNRLREAGIPETAYRLFLAPCDDTWTRDHGPISVYRQGRRELLDFIFNGWGDKYPAGQDNRITTHLHRAGAFGDSPCRAVDWVLEGGALESDGHGVLLTTTRCLTAATRNPDLSREQIEARLRELLGIQHFLWLDHGALQGDDTDSHIDTLARFCSPHTIAHVACDDPDDPHYPELRAMVGQLAEFRQPDGRPYQLVPLPWPQARYDEQGQRLPATYANFLVINGAVLVPTYRDPADALALQILGQCFPDREIIGVDCLPLIREYGSLHCVTMQLPTAAQE